MGKETLLTLSGSIDESADLPALLSRLTPLLGGASLLNLDLGKIQRINSVGTRDWVYFIEQLQKITRVQFSLLSEPFVDQGLFVPNALGKPGTRVVAFEAPYFCDGCNARTMKVLSPSDVVTGADGLIGPRFKCAQCGKVLIFDGIEDQYFRFTPYVRG